MASAAYQGYPPHFTENEVERAHAVRRDLDGDSLFSQTITLVDYKKNAERAVIDRCARLCDEVVRNKRDYGPAERALAKKLAEQMRGGGR